MLCSAHAVSVSEILPWRDLYRQEMHCQIVHDSMHVREGWTEPYLLKLDDLPVGYGSILIAGPWVGTRTLFEFFVAGPARQHVFDLFECLLEKSRATALRAQTNDILLTVMLHLWSRSTLSEKIVFEDRATTFHRAAGAILRSRGGEEADWVLEVNGSIAAKGGILYHYNRPYGDIYMEVEEPLRRRGLGTFLVQELKRVCYERGSIPCARCNPDNIASRRTLQKAGFVPCAHILDGKL